MLRVFKTSMRGWRPLVVGFVLYPIVVSLALAQPATVGQWEGPFSWPFAASHAVLLANGRVLMWSDLGDMPQIWDPASGSFASASSPDTLAAGARALLLADGDVVILGGRDASGAGSIGVTRFSASDNLWTTLPSMNQSRDEGAAVLLGDGRVVALGGDQLLGQGADVPEHAAPGSTWVQLTEATLTLPRSSWVYALQDGDVLVAGPDRTTRQLRLSGLGTWSSVGDMLLGSRDGGTSVLVPGASDQVLIIGGRSPATSSCEILDVPNTMAWVSTGSMARARRHHNATLLADGTVLVSGGTLLGDEALFSVYEAELYDPTTETWTLLDSMTVSRRRGSVALLLPDARVLCAGGGDGSPGSELQADAEIFSPPYLFQGERPTITTAPDSVLYASEFIVGSPEALNIGAVWMVRSGSVSASFNPDQRAVALPFTKAPGELTIMAPDSSHVAPPGFYMLFVVDDSGVPSVAKLLRLTTGPPLVPAPNITSTPAPTARVGVHYAYAAQASGGTPITWSIMQGPSWIGVNGVSGIVTGIPQLEGPVAVTLRADNAGGFDEQTWTLEVLPPEGEPQTLIALGADWRYFKGDADPGTNWAAFDYDDTSWPVGASGFGFGDADDATVLDDMQGNYSTVFTRHTFQLQDKASVVAFALLYQFDDGLAVFLNGQRIFSDQAPDPVLHTSFATGAHEASAALIRQDFNDAASLALLQEGANVLAAVGLNRVLWSTDATLKVTLEVTGSTGTDVNGDTLTRSRFKPARPNPFASVTQVSFSTSRAGTAYFEIFDVAGHRVHKLAARVAAGPHVLQWNGQDDSGRLLAPGIYFYRLRAPGLDRRGKLTRTPAQSR